MKITSESCDVIDIGDDIAIEGIWYICKEIVKWREDGKRVLDEDRILYTYVLDL